MRWGPREDGDAIAEAVAARVKIDGMARRCPWLFCVLFGVKVKPLPADKVEGYFDARTLTIYLDMSGDEQEIRARLAHEIGHVMLFLMGYRFPHDESLASRAGRAWCIGRGAITRALREMHREQVKVLHSDFLPMSEVSARIWEVQVTTMRSTG